MSLDVLLEGYLFIIEEEKAIFASALRLTNVVDP